MTNEEQIAEWKKLSGDITKLEAALEATKIKRNAVVKSLFDEHGKGHVYDLGTGKEMVISTTKIGTHFFTPKDKWTGPRKPRAKKEKPAEGEAVDAAPKADPKATFQEAVAKANKVPVETVQVTTKVVAAPNSSLSPSDPTPEKKVVAVDEEDPLMAALAEATAASE